MRRSAALIGRGTGPVVSVRGRAELSLKGLREGETVRVATFCEAGKPAWEHELTHGGEPLTRYELNNCAYAQVTYEGANRHFIACVLMGA